MDRGTWRATVHGAQRVGHDGSNRHFHNLLSLMGLPGGSAGKESTCSVGDLGLIPGLGRSPGGGSGYSLQYSGLENSMAWAAHGVAKSGAQLSEFHFHFHQTSEASESDSKSQR